MVDIGITDGKLNRTQAAIREVLDGCRLGLAAMLPMAGPAVIASIAYMDPGNFATNIQAGACAQPRAANPDDRVAYFHAAARRDGSVRQRPPDAGRSVRCNRRSANAQLPAAVADSQRAAAVSVLGKPAASAPREYVYQSLGGQPGDGSPWQDFGMLGRLNFAKLPQLSQPASASAKRIAERKKRRFKAEPPGKWPNLPQEFWLCTQTSLFDQAFGQRLSKS
jgi:hypothetical protein